MLAQNPRAGNQENQRCSPPSRLAGFGARLPSPATAARPKPENLLLNLVCNVAVPTAILSWLSDDRWLGPRWSLLVALAFPVGYGLHDFVTRRRWNFISIIGFASVLISGGFALMKVGGLWFAVKDAAIPTVIGLAVLASTRAKTPLVNELLYNPQVIDVDKVDAALAARGTQAAFAGRLRAVYRRCCPSPFSSARPSTSRWRATCCGARPARRRSTASWPRCTC